MTKLHDEPSETSAEDGEVMLDGPGNVSVSMTPDAAAETAERLGKSASEAHEQSAQQT
jgi:hypothetical protein